MRDVGTKLLLSRVLLIQLSVYPFNTLKVCYKDIEDMHEEI